MKKYLAVYGKPRYLGIVEYDGEIERGIDIVAESIRGEETATVVGEINEKQEAEYRLMKTSAEHGDGIVKVAEPVVTDLTFIALASQEDRATADAYREEEKEILKLAKKLLLPHKLEMKLIDVEFLRMKKKLFLYFSSDQRVDFRAYVRDLAHEFRTRIELRQVGVRDEAKIIKGVGPCGRPCCCSYWLNQFSPICIKMVKEQNLALNPTKISGICGRLMCCMCYEYETYHEAWENFPNPGTKIKTPNGNIIISGIDLPKASIKCFIPGKGEIKVPKEKFEEFKAKVTAGEEWIVPEEVVEEPPLRIQDLFPKSMQRPDFSTEPKCPCGGCRCDSDKKIPEAEPQESRKNQDDRNQQKKRRRRPIKNEGHEAADKQETLRQPQRQKPKAPEERHREQREMRVPADIHEAREQRETRDAIDERKNVERPRRHFQRRKKPGQQKPTAE